MKLVKSSILNPIQVAAEVNAALKDNTLVVVTKGANGYDIYAAAKGVLKGGQIKEEAA